MDKIDVIGFFLLGISTRTSNANGQSAKDIGGLWNRFMNDKVLDQIEDRVSDDIYCVYTDYESDHNGAYTTVLGCKVNDIDNIPEGLTSLTVAPAGYIKYTAKGKLPDAVAQTWQHIWNSSIDREYMADFDVYGAKAWNQEAAEVDVYVGVK